MRTTMPDRAYRPRFPFHSRGRLFIGGHSYDGMIVDISAHAALFATDRRIPFALDERCRLEVLHGRLTLAAEAAGRVVHCRDALVSVRFDAAAAGLQEQLTRLVELNLGTPPLVKRDLGALMDSVVAATAAGCNKAVTRAC